MLAWEWDDGISIQSQHFRSSRQDRPAPAPSSRAMAILKMQLLLWTCKFLRVTHGQWKCREREGHLCSSFVSLSSFVLLSSHLLGFLLFGFFFRCAGGSSGWVEVFWCQSSPWSAQHLTHSARFVLTKFNSKILRSVLLLSFPFDWLTAGRSFADDLWIQRLMSTSMQDIHPPWHSGWRVSADLKGTIPGLFVIPITNNMGHGPQNFFEIKNLFGSLQIVWVCSSPWGTLSQWVYLIFFLGELRLWWFLVFFC